MESDNGVSGSGTTLPDALAAMRERAEGTLFLDTAEHIIPVSYTHLSADFIARGGRIPAPMQSLKN